MIKIVAGKYGGRILETPKGRDIRPTTNRVREALFSSLYNYIEGANVLDAFAGSGALGIEALSRGAAYVCFCDTNTNTVKKNIEKLKIDNYEILQCDTFNHNFIEKFNLVFIDPPYKTDLKQIMDLIENLKKNENLTENAIIIYEHNNNIVVPESYKTKRYGNIVLDFIGA